MHFGIKQPVSHKGALNVISIIETKTPEREPHAVLDGSLVLAWRREGRNGGRVFGRPVRKTGCPEAIHAFLI